MDLKLTVEQNSHFQSYGYTERGYYVDLTLFGEDPLTCDQLYKYERVIRALFESQDIRQFQYQGLAGREMVPNKYGNPHVYGVYRFLVVVRKDGSD